MATEEADGNADYVAKAVAAFNEIMSGNQKDMLEDMNRAHKGELFVLHFLSIRDTTVLPSELSEALHSSTARISALLGSLEKKGQIERDIDRSNRRNILVTITDAGRARVSDEMRRIEENMARVFTEMGEADTMEFLRLARLFFGLMQKHMSC